MAGKLCDGRIVKLLSGSHPDEASAVPDGATSVPAGRSVVLPKGFHPEEAAAVPDGASPVVEGRSVILLNGNEPELPTAVPEGKSPVPVPLTGAVPSNVDHWVELPIANGVPVPADGLNGVLIAVADVVVALFAVALFAAQTYVCTAPESTPKADSEPKSRLLQSVLVSAVPVKLPAISVA